MRQLVEAEASVFKPIEWISMKYEADCWIAACAMAAGVSYEVAEEYFGSGAEYSDDVLSENDDPKLRWLANFQRFLLQGALFTEHGRYPLFLPDINPILKLGRRYLLSCKSYDPQRPCMAHSFVVDETGKVFDPDPTYDPASPKFSITNYSGIIGWEIVGWET